MELVFLGTSGMQPTKERNHPGLLLTYEGEGLLFDCGEGIQRQLRVAEIKPTIIRKIFISHWHGDHVLGLPGLLQTLSASGYEGKIDLYGPKGTKKFMGAMHEAFASKDLIDVVIHEVMKGMICDGADYMVIADELHHSAPCVGYAFCEKNKRKIVMARARKFGLSAGPLIGKLQGGEEITHKGVLIRPDDVSTVVRGRKIAYVTDTRPCSGAVRLAYRADILVIESTYRTDMKEKAEEYLHLTAEEAALIANQAEVKQLILTHFSMRYKDSSEIEDDARVVFDRCRVAYDLMRVRL